MEADSIVDDPTTVNSFINWMKTIVNTKQTADGEAVEKVSSLVKIKTKNVD